MPKVDPKDLDPCVGNPKAPCGRIADPMIQGFDKKWRCSACNSVHTELVYQEAGSSAPNPGVASKNIGVKREDVEASRRLEILARNAPRGGFTTPSPVAARPGDPTDLKSFIAQKKAAPKESEADRRARILRKYRG